MVKHDDLVKVYGITQFVLSCFLFVIASMARIDGFSGNCLPPLLIPLHANEVQRHDVAPHQNTMARSTSEMLKTRLFENSDEFAFLLCKVYTFHFFSIPNKFEKLAQIEYLLVAMLGL